MKINKKLLPYYLSRAVLAALIGWLLARPSRLEWMGVVIGLLLFAGFVYYLRSGRFIVDEDHPLFPLRRDDRAKTIRNQALVAAVVVGGLLYVLFYILNQVSSIPDISASLAFPVGVVVYFVYSLALDKTN